MNGLIPCSTDCTTALDVDPMRTENIMCEEVQLHSVLSLFCCSEQVYCLQVSLTQRQGICRHAAITCLTLRELDRMCCRCADQSHSSCQSDTKKVPSALLWHHSSSALPRLLQTVSTRLIQYQAETSAIVCIKT